MLARIAAHPFCGFSQVVCAFFFFFCLFYFALWFGSASQKANAKAKSEITPNFMFLLRSHVA